MLFMEENTFENDVCETAVILPRPQCVNFRVTVSYIRGPNLNITAPADAQTSSAAAVLTTQER